jgi:nitroreductase
MTLYETIFVRRSVRKYIPQPLAPEELKKIETYFNGIKQLKNCRVSIKFATAGEVTDKHAKDAQHYILCYCQHTTEEFINVGYVMQQMDLYLQSKGLGSVWLGIPNPKDVALKQDDYCIMMAFGSTEVPKRGSESEFNRLPIAEVGNCDNAVVNAGRLAPSATNSQPWKFLFDDGKVTADYFGRGVLKAWLRKKFSKIDLGIASKHIELALQNEGKEVSEVMPKSDKNDFRVEIFYK